MTRARHAADAFFRGFRQGWSEARLSPRTILAVVVSAAAATAIGLTLLQGLR